MKESRADGKRICKQCKYYIAKVEDGICGKCKPRGTKTTTGQTTVN